MAWLGEITLTPTSFMSRLPKVLILICFIFGLFACGQRGPLYMPEQEPNKNEPSESDKTTDVKLAKRAQKELT